MKDQIQTALLKAHVKTDKTLYRNQNIDDFLSGTTAISAYFHGRRNRVSISNVGDSRAVLGQETVSPCNGTQQRVRTYSKVKAQPLS